MLLSKALEEKKLDLRLRAKLLHEGQLARDTVDKYLETLPDDASNAVPAETGGRDDAPSEGPVTLS